MQSRLIAILKIVAARFFAPEEQNVYSHRHPHLPAP